MNVHKILAVDSAGYNEITPNLNVQLKSACHDSASHGDMMSSCADWTVKEVCRFLRSYLLYKCCACTDNTQFNCLNAAVT
jgi:hypothetical protein